MSISYNAKDKDGESMTKPFALRLSIKNHLDKSTSEYECMATISDDRLITYQEDDKVSTVTLLIEKNSLLLIRQNESRTQIAFKLEEDSTFFIETDEGRIIGEVHTTVLKTTIEHIHIEYQLILEGKAITHQSIHYYLKELKA
ncbi:MAG: DUF1934 family protein [Erysipelotrichaceae bacterium]